VKYRAVLFDLDGTLVDSLQDLADSMNEALCELGYTGHARAAYRDYVGDGIIELARRALPPTARGPAVVDSCVAAMRRIYAQRWNATTRPYAGIAELLDTLRESGTAIAVLSNKPHDMTTRVVAEILAPWRFASVVGARPGVARKPAPDAALWIAHEIQVPAERIAYVGDTGTDMKTARAAGMFAIGALWGFRDEGELLGSGAAALAQLPGDIPGFLG